MDDLPHFLYICIFLQCAKNTFEAQKHDKSYLFLIWKRALTLFHFYAIVIIQTYFCCWWALVFIRVMVAGRADILFVGWFPISYTFVHCCSFDCLIIHCIFCLWPHSEQVFTMYCNTGKSTKSNKKITAIACHSNLEISVTSYNNLYSFWNKEMVHTIYFLIFWH